MRRALAVLALGVLAAGPASAQTTTYAQTGTADSPVRKLLADGYEIKTGFSDNSGGAYILLQKATSAYMCHSNPTPACEKLN